MEITWNRTEVQNILIANGWQNMKYSNKAELLKYRLDKFRCLSVDSIEDILRDMRNKRHKDTFSKLITFENDTSGVIIGTKRRAPEVMENERRFNCNLKLQRQLTELKKDHKELLLKFVCNTYN